MLESLRDFWEQVKQAGSPEEAVRCQGTWRGIWEELREMDEDDRKRKLAINIDYYLEQTTAAAGWDSFLWRTHVVAMTKVLHDLAVYEQTVANDPAALRARHEAQFALCRSLREKPKEPVEENSGKPYEISIVITTYNQLRMTMECVERILANTGNVKYEIILIENGSSDGTFEHFSAQPGIKILRFVENVSLLPALQVFYESGMDEGKFWMYMNNDALVSPDWARRMLTCMQSDPSIATVMPTTNIVAVPFTVPISFPLYDYKAFLKFSKEYGKNTEQIWEDFVELYAFVGLHRPSSRRLFGFFEDMFYFKFYYADGDVTTLLNKAGYRLVVCKNVYVHHIHGASWSNKKSANTFRKEAKGSAVKDAAERIRRQYDIEETLFFHKHGYFSSEVIIENKSVLNSIEYGNTSPLKVLVIGAMRGAEINYIRRRFNGQRNFNVKYYGVEFDEIFAEDLARNADFHAICESVYDAPKAFGKERFNIVYYAGQLALLRDVTGFLRKVHDALAHNGVLLFAHNCAANILSLSKIVMGSRVMMRDRARLRKTSYMEVEDLLDRIEKGGMVVLGTKKDYYLTHPGCDLRHSQMIYRKLVARGRFNRALRALDNYQVVIQAIRTD